jgi:hypothetical protein
MILYVTVVQGPRRPGETSLVGRPPVVRRDPTRPATAPRNRPAFWSKAEVLYLAAVASAGPPDPVVRAWWGFRRLPLWAQILIPLRRARGGRGRTLRGVSPCSCQV